MIAKSNLNCSFARMVRLRTGPHPIAVTSCLCLCVFVQFALIVVPNIRHAGRIDRAALHPFQLSRIRKLGQIAADRLHRNLEPVYRILDHHFALVPGEFQDLRLTKGQNAIPAVLGLKT